MSAVLQQDGAGQSDIDLTRLHYDPLANDAKRPDWMALLDEALHRPGVLSDAYRQFHRYSAGNAMLVALQVMFRGLPLGPVASFKAWQSKGYQVKKGERALAMVMPVTVTKRGETDGGENTAPVGKSPTKKIKSKSKINTGRSSAAGSGGDAKEKGRTMTIFMFKRNWFLFSQVEPGENAQPLDEAKTPEWSLDLAADKLGIAITQFDMMDGNCQGYASKSGIAINPMAKHPVKTGAHELAHVLLGHLVDDDRAIVDHEELPRSKAEAEAESVAFIVAASLGISEDALSSARAYIQNWLGAADEKDRDEFKKKSAARIFSVADKILRAGRTGETENPSAESGNSEQAEPAEAVA
jgi:antirestriction protein ArdC